MTMLYSMPGFIEHFNGHYYAINDFSIVNDKNGSGLFYRADTLLSIVL